MGNYIKINDYVLATGWPVPYIGLAFLVCLFLLGMWIGRITR